MKLSTIAIHPSCVSDFTYTTISSNQTTSFWLSFVVQFLSVIAGGGVEILKNWNISPQKMLAQCTTQIYFEAGVM